MEIGGEKVRRNLDAEETERISDVIICSDFR